MSSRPLVQYSPTADESATVAVVRALSEAGDGDPYDGDATLRDDVDTDALDALFDADVGSADVRVTFETRGFRVAVSTAGDRLVTVYGAQSG
ncbi:hypothetical protein BRC97_03415 [Halobacteriales archaeon QS_6_71_20]|nr:MAG: hypothetical protein BRC97_03415 [Halobacteriales archaeon QS_6_71_20]